MEGDRYLLRVLELDLHDFLWKTKDEYLEGSNERWSVRTIPDEEFPIQTLFPYHRDRVEIALPISEW